jgi:predicted TPR repeat methyltransferase
VITALDPLRMRPAEPYSRLAAVDHEIVIDACHHRWAAYLHHLWQADEAGVRTVLDLCCGTGLMAAELGAIGYRVDGADRSTAMLARARRLLRRDAVLTEQTLPELTIDGVYDAIVSTFDGLNYLTSSELHATLAAAARRPRPHGWLVFDLHTDAMMNFTATNPVVEGHADGTHLEISSVVDLAARTCDTRIVVTGTDDGETFNEQHRQYFHSDAEVRNALATAGFELISVTDEYTSTPVDRSSLRATWAARHVTS